MRSGPLKRPLQSRVRQAEIYRRKRMVGPPSRTEIRRRGTWVAAVVRVICRRLPSTASSQ
jgi:hypothetical protein